MGKKCEQEGCIVCPVFNFKGGKGRFCKSHKIAGMIDVKSRYCEYDGCESIQPVYNFQGERGRFCKMHKAYGMVNVKSKRCEYDGCDKTQPVFDIQGGKGKFCKAHKLPGMIDVKNQRCQHDNCGKLNPTFDIKGGKGRFCKIHKLPDMVDVRNKRCEYDGCESLNPVFDIIGKIGRFCIKHKSAEMIDVRSKKCKYEGCRTQPSFNIKGGKGIFCKLHKTSEMVEVKTKRCQYDGCLSINPVFDVKGGKGRFCVTHKTLEMIDIKSKQCTHEVCTTRPSYGKPGHPPSHCAQHKQPGMIRKSNAKCATCKNPALWGTNWIPTHCDLHKTEDETNLVEQPCSSCGLSYLLDKENTCEHCNPASFASARLAKQNALMHYLDARGLNGDSTDRVIDNGECGKERPDRIYDLGDKILILECDEDQHKGRQCVCEQTRMVNIGQSFGGTPVYFLRWNPDNYSPQDEKKQPEVIAKRHTLAGDLIASIIAGKTQVPTNTLVSALYLYYDGWSTLADETWASLTAKGDPFIL